MNVPSLVTEGTTRLTRPHSSAWAAGIRLLSRSISRARRSPTWIGSHWVAPPAATLPTRVPTWPSQACSAITARSQASWDSLPPPAAMPLIRAMTGLPALTRLSIQARKSPMYFQ